MNGIALHGLFKPYGGTFLAFADYCRPSIRLSALMGVPATYVMTRDSIGLGEDGPTHQPVEHLASLRAIPNLTVIRPAEAVETAEAWEIAMRSKTTPTMLILSRQNLPTVRHAVEAVNRVAEGAYLLRDPAARAATLIATGSEVEIALAAATALAGEGIEAAIRQGWDLFLRPDDAFVGMAGFGASAPVPDLYGHFGITSEAVANQVKSLI
jgi:transketolase